MKNKDRRIRELEERCRAAEEQLARIREEQMPVKPRFLPIGSAQRKGGADRARDVMGL